MGACVARYGSRGALVRLQLGAGCKNRVLRLKLDAGSVDFGPQKTWAVGEVACDKL